MAARKIIVAMICAAHNGAHGFRGESRAEGRKRREDGANDRQPTNSGVCVGARQPGVCAVSSAQPRQKDGYSRKKVVAIRAVESIRRAYSSS